MDLTKKHCVPCEGGTLPLTNKEEEGLLKEAPGWQLIRDPSTSSGQAPHRIRRLFKFKDFKGAMTFVNKIARIAEKEDHHPNIKINYSRVELELYTHSIGGLSENDFILAAKINELVKSAS